MKIENIDEAISEHEEEIKKLKKQKAEFEKLTPAHRLAELLHEKQCHFAHEDQCGWYYEKWDNPGYSRKEYLNKATAILNVVSYENAVKVIKHI